MRAHAVAQQHQQREDAEHGAEGPEGAGEAGGDQAEGVVAALREEAPGQHQEGREERAGDDPEGREGHDEGADQGARQRAALVRRQGGRDHGDADEQVHQGQQREGAGDRRHDVVERREQPQVLVVLVHRDSRRECTATLARGAGRRPASNADPCPPGRRSGPSASSSCSACSRSRGGSSTRGRPRGPPHRRQPFSGAGGRPRRRAAGARPRGRRGGRRPHARAPRRPHRRRPGGAAGGRAEPRGRLDLHRPRRRRARGRAPRSPARRAGSTPGARANAPATWRWPGRATGACVGRVLERGARAARPARAARIVLRRRGDGYFVLTAYPEIER